MKPGTQTVELGPPPAGTTDIDLTLTCLTAGSFFTADGANLQCDRQDAGTGQMDGGCPSSPASTPPSYAPAMVSDGA